MAHAGGRPNEYTEEILTKTKEYIDSCVDEQRQLLKQANQEKGYEMYENKLKVNLPTIEGLALYLKVSVKTLYNWEKDFPEFLQVMGELRQKQANALISNGLSGDYNSTIAKVLLTKHGYREGIDQTTNDKDLPIPLLNGIYNHNSNDQDSETKEEN
jgi:hypothetical protein